MLEWLFKASKKTPLKSSPPKSMRSPEAGADEALLRKIDDALQHHRAGRLPEAEAAYREVLGADPDNIDALHFLGVIAYQLGRHDQAEALISRALLQNASNASAHNNLGNALQAQGKLEQALTSYRRALALEPNYVDALVNLGATYRAQGDLDQAVASYQKALALRPDAPMVCFHLGNILVEQGRQDQAVAYYRQAIALRPGLAEVHSNLGNALRDCGRLGEAIVCYREALALRPDFPEAHYNLGNVLKDVGEVEEAVCSYRQALALAPDYAEARSNLLCALNYVPGLRPGDIYAEHREYARRHCPAGAPRTYRNTRDVARRLRVGYVSGDFRRHPVAHFIEPVLARHHRNRVEVFCYYNNPRADDVTARIRSRADGWRDVFVLRDEAVVDLVLDDAIDILVDLSGHTGLHRLPVFGRKPAPVQATWLGYLNTTGLDAIDYRITDSHASPEGLFDAYHSEHLVRLPDSQWCYQPPSSCPEVCTPPSANGGPFTFAAFSNLAKIGAPVIELWSRLVMQVPDSRLLIVGPGLASVRSQFLERFTRRGVPAARVQLEEGKPFPDYLAMHREADVMLDTFPYNGGTTTCHALWMGVPLVSLAGETAPCRGGASVLNAIGLGELVAETPEKYLGIASSLAHDRRRLAALRSGMRERMRNSALMDSERFACNLEDAYAAMWRSWCEKQ